MENRIIIAGGSGFIGRSLAQVLDRRGYDVFVLTRHPQSYRGSGVPLEWDGKSLGSWARLLDGAHAVVNLAGRNVNCRYTPTNLREIDQSRINAVRIVAEAIRRAARPPSALVQASTLAIYGDAGDQPCDEAARFGQGIPVETATAWEQAFFDSPTPATRRVILRISFALGPDGGVLQTLGTLARLGLGGPVGSGQQFVSWIHLFDLQQMFLWAIERPDIRGIYNATSPSPVRNHEFMRQLRHTLHASIGLPSPAPLVHLGAFFLRTEPVLALTGRRGVPRRFTEAGFKFRHPVLPEAFNSIYHARRQTPLSAAFGY